MNTWLEHEVFTLTMNSLIADVDGVGKHTIRVFHGAGFTKIVDVFNDRGQEDAVRATALRLAEEAGNAQAGHWRALASRCITIIRRIRCAEATPFCPEHFICPITYLCTEDPVITKYGHTYERWAIYI